ncbi:MAG: aminoacetone oxidase family FAD-binding enzyme [Candidatus Gastranaerophilales bacterium]|nr:aminoacetone oxidase family FAD-binding enzyme [Candidatus Gastranaerophilales bacterium]
MEQFCQDKITKIAIVGAGPSGIYCALQILFGFKEQNFSNFKLLIFDKAQALRTILPTGGGRCNLTNSITDIKEFSKNYPRGEKFLYSLFSRHFNFDTLEFFETIDIKTYTQEDGRIFPKSNSAKDVKDKMLSALRKFKNVELVNKNIVSKDELKSFDRIIICAGSKGTSELIESFNQPMKPFKRALCALKIKDFKYPKGVSVKSLDGDFIFTSDGISGPLAFKISSLNVDKNFPYNVSIKLFDVQQLFELIDHNSKKSIGNLISTLIPKSLAQVIVDDFDKKAAEVSKRNIEKYSVLNLEIIDNANQGEIVHSGGVELNSVDKNCKSKIVDNLWFCGEILDIDGLCGGFNLQNCWSSAYVVAKDVIYSIINK